MFHGLGVRDCESYDPRATSVYHTREVSVCSKLWNAGVLTRLGFPPTHQHRVEDCRRVFGSRETGLSRDRSGVALEQASMPSMFRQLHLESGTGQVLTRDGKETKTGIRLETCGQVLGKRPRAREDGNSGKGSGVSGGMDGP